MKLFKFGGQLLCGLGIHGPDWFGIGPDANSSRNYRIGAVHRRCDVCGTEWIGAEGAGETRRHYIWQRLTSQKLK